MYHTPHDRLQTILIIVFVCWKHRREEHPFKSLDEIPVTWVETVEELEKVAAKLEKVTDFAVDLEAHNYRTYCSFACLMQISTRTEDFLIDTLASHTSVSRAHPTPWNACLFTLSTRCYSCLSVCFLLICSALLLGTYK